MTRELVIPRGITRYERGRTKGWRVRVPAQRLFSDGVYGGEAEALDAATRWQSKQQELAPAPTRERKRTPGYGYVQRATRRYRTKTGELRSYDVFVAYVWDAEGKPNSTSWSIETHGEALARQNCEDWLERERQQLGGLELAQAG